MDNVKKIQNGEEYLLCVPYNHILGNMLTEKKYFGYRFKCVDDCIKTTIYYISQDFYNKKQYKIGAFLYNIEKDVITFEQCGYENKHNCISLYGDIFRLLRAQDLIRIKGRNKKCRTVYSAPVVRLISGGVEQCSEDKFIFVSKKLLTQSLEKY